MKFSYSYDVKVTIHLPGTSLESTFIRSYSHSHPAIAPLFVAGAILVVNEIVSVGNNGKHFGCGKFVVPYPKVQCT
jgi:hypothetical protein